MSFSKVFSAQTNLLNANIVDVEVDISKGLHNFSVVGLPDKAVEESRDRVSASIKNSGFEPPKGQNQKIVVSLAPANLKKEGPNFDLAIALVYLLAKDEINFNPENKIFLGELALDGTLRKIKGTLPLVREAQKRGFEEIYLPKENAVEGALIKGVKIYGATNLQEVIDHLENKKDKKIKPQPTTEIELDPEDYLIDFAEIRGQRNAKRGLEIAAAGGHNIAMFGPPGTGKTMLAKAFCHILPPLDFDDVLEVTSIYSIAGLLSKKIITQPPFRAPHHTASYIAVVGGGAVPKPGEVTLAHKGVLFVDEFPEFDRRVIDSLRQPLEDKKVSISRSKGSAIFPANFILIATMNPCPCGNYGSKNECICSLSSIQKYQRKISGPIVDRIDMWVEVSSIDYKSLSEKSYGKEGTNIIKKRVQRARKIQEERFGKAKNNADMKTKEIEKYVELDKRTKSMFNKSAQNLNLSARAYHKILKLARTIADLDKSEKVQEKHILEALSYRPKENSV